MESNFLHRKEEFPTDMDSGHQELSAPDELPVSGPSSQQKAPGSGEEAANSQSDKAEPAKRKYPLKRKASPLKNDKSKKKKKSKIRQAPRPSYTIQHGEDMLLIISNINQFDSVWKPKRKGCKKKKTTKKTKITPVKKKKCHPKPKVSKAREEAPVSDLHVDHQVMSSADWGQNLPVEVLVKIFELAVQQDGAVPFLCR